MSSSCSKRAQCVAKGFGSNPRRVFPDSKANEQPGQAAGMGRGSLRNRGDLILMQRDGPDDPLVFLALKKIL